MLSTPVNSLKISTVCISGTLPSVSRCLCSPAGGPVSEWVAANFSALPPCDLRPRLVGNSPPLKFKFIFQ